MKYLIGYTFYIQIAWFIVVIFSSLMKFFLPSKYTEDIEDFQFNVVTIGGIVVALIFLLALIASVIWQVTK